MYPSDDLISKQIMVSFDKQVEIPVYQIAYFCAYTAGCPAPIFVLLAKANNVKELSDKQTPNHQPQ
jgi:hypothetical protein